jgi:hypothetical protein
MRNRAWAGSGTAGPGARPPTHGSRCTMRAGRAPALVARDEPGDLPECGARQMRLGGWVFKV